MNIKLFIYFLFSLFLSINMSYAKDDCKRLNDMDFCVKGSKCDWVNFKCATKNTQQWRYNVLNDTISRFPDSTHGKEHIGFTFRFKRGACCKDEKVELKGGDASSWSNSHRSKFGLYYLRGKVIPPGTDPNIEQSEYFKNPEVASDPRFKTGYIAPAYCIQRYIPGLNKENWQGCITESYYYPPPLYPSLEKNTYTESPKICDITVKNTNPGRQPTLCNNIPDINYYGTFICPKAYLYIINKENIISDFIDYCAKPSVNLGGDKNYKLVKTENGQQFCVKHDGSDESIGCFEPLYPEKPIIRSCATDSECVSTNEKPVMVVEYAGGSYPINFGEEFKIGGQEITLPGNNSEKLYQNSLTLSTYIYGDKGENPEPNKPGLCGLYNNQLYYIDKIEMSTPDEESDEVIKFFPYIRGGKKLCLEGYDNGTLSLVKLINSLDSEGNTIKIPSIWPEDIIIFDYKDDMVIDYNGRIKPAVSDSQDPRKTINNDYEALITPSALQQNLCVDIPKVKTPPQPYTKKACEQFGSPVYNPAIPNNATTTNADPSNSQISGGIGG